MNVQQTYAVYQVRNLIRRHCNANLLKYKKMRPRTIDCIEATINVRYELVKSVDPVELKVHFLIATAGDLDPDESAFNRHVVKFNGGYKILYYLTGFTEISEFISRMPRKLPFGIVAFPELKNLPLTLCGFLRAIDTGLLDYGIWKRKKYPMKLIKEQAITHGFSI